MKRIATVFVVVLCALALVSSAAFADQCSMSKCNFSPKCHKMWSKKGHEEMFFHKVRLALAKAAELGLSDDQVSKIKDIEYTFKKSLIKKDADIKSLCLDIKEAVGKDTVDINSVNSLIDKKYAIKADKAKEAVQACANLKKILTKDQSDKLKEMRRHGIWGKKGREDKEAAEAQEGDE